MGLCLGSARVWRLDRRFNVRPAGGCGAGPADGSTPGGPCRFVVLVHTVAAPTDHSPGRRAGGDGDAGCERMLWPRPGGVLHHLRVRSRWPERLCDRSGLESGAGFCYRVQTDRAVHGDGKGVLASHKCHGWQLHLRATGPCYHDDLSVHAVVAARLGVCSSGNPTSMATVGLALNLRMPDKRPPRSSTARPVGAELFPCLWLMSSRPVLVRGAELDFDVARASAITSAAHAGVADQGATALPPNALCAACSGGRMFHRCVPIRVNKPRA